jgi:hypothetical protein
MTDDARQSRLMRYAPHLFGPLSIAVVIAAGTIVARLGGGIDAIFAAVAGGLALNMIGLLWQAVRLVKVARRRRQIDADSADAYRE